MGGGCAAWREPFVGHQERKVKKTENKAIEKIEIDEETVCVWRSWVFWLVGITRG